MAKGYWVAHVDIDDMETYKSYIAANAAPFAEFGARFLVRGGTRTVCEGQARARNAIIEFPDYDSALAFYDCDAYRAVLPHAMAGSEREVVIVEGVEEDA